MFKLLQILDVDRIYTIFWLGIDFELVEIAQAYQIRNRRIGILVFRFFSFYYVLSNPYTTKYIKCLENLNITKKRLKERSEKTVPPEVISKRMCYAKEIMPIQYRNSYFLVLICTWEPITDTLQRIVIQLC